MALPRKSIWIKRRRKFCSSVAVLIIGGVMNIERVGSTNFRLECRLYDGFLTVSVGVENLLCEMVQVFCLPQAHVT